MGKTLQREWQMVAALLSLGASLGAAISWFSGIEGKVKTEYESSFIIHTVWLAVAFALGVYFVSRWIEYKIAKGNRLRGNLQSIKDIVDEPSMPQDGDPQEHWKKSMKALCGAVKKAIATTERTLDE